MDEKVSLFIVGLIAAILSYFLKNFVSQPLLEYKQVKGRIQNRLKYNANKIHDADKEVLIEVSKEFRQLSCDLEEKYYGIALRKVLVFMGAIPKIEIISEAASNLIGLSNSVGTKEYENSSQMIQRVKDNLQII